MNLVILGADPAGKYCAKVFYASSYVQDSDEPPDCSSSDGIRPDSWITNPVCSNCAECPNNAWGSGKKADGSPSEGKACGDVKKLLCVAPNNVEKGDVYMLQVPPTSLKALSKYGRELAKHNLPVEACVTKITFADTEHPQLEFGLAGFLNEQDANTAEARSKSPQVMDLIHTIEDPATPHPAPMNDEPAPAQAEPAAAPTGPVVEQQAPPAPQETEVEIDAAGVAWNPEIHDAKKGKKQDGTWKARRGRKAKENGEATPPAKANGADDDFGAFSQAAPDQSGGFQQPEQAPTGNALDSILDGNW